MLDSFKIGHASYDDCTGCTCILAENGAIAGVSIRGGAPGTRETDLLKSENTVQKINAVVLSGGSAFGLDACSGVMDYLYCKDVGFDASGFIVPLVCGAVIFDLAYKKWGYPDKELGKFAAMNAKKNNFVSGNIGAATGATVGKLLGMENSSKTNLGVATLKAEDGLEIAAIAVVNAFGDIVDEKGNILLGLKNEKGEFIDTVSVISNGTDISAVPSNTTIACVISNAKVTKSQANKVADVCHDALSRHIRPVHTSVDGDAVFFMSDDSVECDQIRLQTLATQTLAKAIMASAQTK